MNVFKTFHFFASGEGNNVLVFLEFRVYLSGLLKILNPKPQAGNKMRWAADARVEPIFKKRPFLDILKTTVS